MMFCWASCTLETTGWCLVEDWRREEGGEPGFGFTQMIYKEEEGKANFNSLSLVDVMPGVSSYTVHRILSSITHSQANKHSHTHWLPSSLLTQVKEGIKDLIHSCHCLSHLPDSSLLKHLTWCAGILQASSRPPTRRRKWFPEVLWVASEKDWEPAHIMIGECLQTRQCQRKGCVSVL